jgi:hypothetical protein
MTKNQQLLLGVGVVGVAGYLYWKSKQPKAAFAGVGPQMRNLAGNAKRNASGNLKGVRMNADGTRKIAGKVQPLGSDSFGKRGFAEQKLSGDAKFAQAVGSINPIFHVEGAHVGTPAFWS